MEAHVLAVLVHGDAEVHEEVLLVLGVVDAGPVDDPADVVRGELGEGFIEDYVLPFHVLEAFPPANQEAPRVARVALRRGLQNEHTQLLPGVLERALGALRLDGDVDLAVDRNPEGLLRG